MHHLFGWRRQGIQALLYFLGWLALWFAVFMIGAALRSTDPKVLIGVAPNMTVFAASLSALLTIIFVAVPLLAWPWTRRSYGRRLELRIEQMSESELDQQIGISGRELDDATGTAKGSALEAWACWLQNKRLARATDSQLPLRALLTLRPSRRKLITSTACAAVPLAAGLWLILLAIVGGDGGTGIEGFRGPNAVWTKSVVGSLLILVTAVPLIEAFTVRVDLTKIELRKRVLGWILWSIPTQNILLVMDDDGSCRVLDAQTRKPTGELNPHHFNDRELLALIGHLRAIG